MRNPELWSRLQAHRFDAPVETPFSAKLAVIENWRDDYTARAVEEYRKFLYLTQMGEEQITPSVPVDRVWHLHLTYTENYWEELVGRVIGRPLHHRPCNAPAELPRYRQQYQKTVALYRKEFGEAPPPDIWPEGATDDPLRPRKTPGRLAKIGGAVAIASFLAIWLSASGVIPVPVVIPILIFVGVIVAALVTTLRQEPKHKRRRQDGDADGGWFAFEYSSRRGDGDGSDGDGDGDGGGCGD